MRDLKKIVGKQVAAHRRRADLTQAQLAEKASLSVDMIAKIEIGAAAPSLRTLETLGEVFLTDPAQLLTMRKVGDYGQRDVLAVLTERLQGVPDDQLEWIVGVVDAALKRQS